jgi:hypothetical protein
MSSDIKNNVVFNTPIKANCFPMHPGTASHPTSPKKLSRSMSAGPILMKKGTEQKEIVITKNVLDDLLSNLSLDEVETVVEKDTALGVEEKSENYYEAIGDPKKLRQLSPWTPDGPILKILPNYFEMFQMVDDEQCVCLLHGCKKEVSTQKINRDSMSPWYFMCREHRIEVTERYGYGPKKII